MELYSNIKEYLYDLYNVAKIFFPNKEIKRVESRSGTAYNTISCISTIENNSFINRITLCIQRKPLSITKTTKIDKWTPLLYKRYQKRAIKHALFEALSELTAVKFPWGVLTGVRPTKLVYEMLENGLSLSKIKNELVANFSVSLPKAELLTKVVANQKGMSFSPNSADLYINIPFCTSKCSYCTFVSGDIAALHSFVEPYVNTLIHDVQKTLQLIKSKKLTLQNIYIGGGTPTSLPDELLDKLLSSFSVSAKEFTVEAGRPDTITKSKLDILQKHKVTRISVNPQTFNDSILKQIGRSHSAQDVLTAYKLAREYPFVINMDLIAGLPNDTLTSFQNSINTCIDLDPDNITVHTLAYKNASELTKQGQTQIQNSIVSQMVEYSNQTLQKAGYSPYYIYRQKNSVENLENVGYAKNGKVCAFNINSMEDFCSCIACGANGVSKRVFPATGKIIRTDSAKDLKTYIENINTMLKRKEDLFNA